VNNNNNQGFSLRRRGVKGWTCVILSLSIFLFITSVNLFAGEEMWEINPDLRMIPGQSTTGPLPPAGVREKRPDKAPLARSDRLTIGVPAYLWRHGCGPTALGMVVGYFDTHGYPGLIPGDASQQTEAVNQVIASQRDAEHPQHYEDYSLPIDTETGGILPDKSAPPAGDEHPSNCIADFMHTSWSADWNRYGWSWSDMIGTAWIHYVNLVAPEYEPQYEDFFQYGKPVTWEVLKGEINANRPMVFLVDTDGNGNTDHFVTVIGYRESQGFREYACLDTWAPADVVRWEKFLPMSAGAPWGIYSGTRFILNASPEPTPTPTPTPAPTPYAAVFYVPKDYPTIGKAIEAATSGTVIIVAPGVYKENIKISGKNIILRSVNPTDTDIVSRTVIDGGGLNTVVTFSGNELTTCVLAGFTITSGMGVVRGGGISGNGTLAHIRNNSIMGNVSCPQSVYSGYIGGRGGGIEGCNGIIENNIIAENSAIGVSSSNEDSISLGGGIFGCNGVIRNNLIFNNRAEVYGAGGGVAYCEVRMENNVLYHNNAADFGGGIFHSGNAIQNCIIWANEAPSTPTAQVGEIYGKVQFSCIQDADGIGEEIITSEPAFADPGKYDFTLADGSPCIDAGNPDPSFNDFCRPPGKGEPGNDMGAFGGAHNFGWNTVGVAQMVDEILGRKRILRDVFPLVDQNGDNIMDVTDIILLLNRNNEQEKK
jgi:hypothetical protein